MDGLEDFQAFVDQPRSMFSGGAMRTMLCRSRAAAARARRRCAPCHRGVLGRLLCFCRLDELHADHQPLAAHVADARMAGTAISSSASRVYSPDLGGVLHEAVLDQLDGLERGGARERVAAVGVAVRAGGPVHDACARSSRPAACRRRCLWRCTRCPARRPSAGSPTTCRCGPCRTAPRPRSAGCRTCRTARAGAGKKPCGGTT